MKRPELLPLAGFLKNRRCAFASGAGAAQAGQPRYGLRVRNFMAPSRPIPNIGLRQRWRETEA
jgi:collagenase-like PrtC family protease